MTAARSSLARLQRVVFMRRVSAVPLLALTALAVLSVPSVAGRVKARPNGSAASAGVPAPLTGVLLQPAQATLDGSYAFQTLAVVGQAGDGSQRDLTDGAAFTSSNPGVIKVGKDNVAYPVSDGQADVTVSIGGRTAKAHFVVKNNKTDANLGFETAITPILVKNGCTGSACHGAPQGQGGLKLSFFGYEAQKDWDTIVKGESGRRIDLKTPMQSLFLRKPANLTGHGGGKRFAPDGPEARVFAAWLRAGAPYKPKAVMQAQAETSKPGLKLVAFGGEPKPEPKAALAPRIESIDVIPGTRLIRQPNSKHQLIVMAKYTDGSERDVTPFARFSSDDDGIAQINSAGKLTALRRGEANLMVRFGGKVGLSTAVVQPQPPLANYPRLPVNNFIDEAVWSKLKTLNMTPSDLCDEATFVRRAYFDIIGTPPLPGAVREFLEDKDANKRAKLIDELLERPEYKDYQTILWSDLLRNTSTLIKEDGVRAYTAFIRASFADNKPFDQFVRDLLTGTGSTYHNESATANYYRVTSDPAELTTSTSQIFLGVRLECCRCHNHPFDRWSQDDFYGVAAFFAKTHVGEGTQKDEATVYCDNNGEVRQLRTGQVMQPKLLTAEQPISDTSGDLRVKLAQWITTKDNPFFAKATVNRLWKQMFGRGIVHPADDFRATNPPINAPLLNKLADDFVAHDYDLKHLIRTICNSRVYQLSAMPNSTNGDDLKNFSHYYIKRLGPEQLLDTISIATGVNEQFPGLRDGTRAINLADNRVGSGFLDVFGRSSRLQVSERSQETSMSQALAMMNGPTLNNKISDPGGRIAKLLARLGDRSDKAILDEIYLAALARFPSDKERKQAQEYVTKSATPKEGYEDLMWVILNTKEFLFNH
jgi:hypothetical protein